LSPAHCSQRDGGLAAGGGIDAVWTRAGGAVRHEVSDEPHPRLRETARYLLAFL